MGWLTVMQCCQLRLLKNTLKSFWTILTGHLMPPYNELTQIATWGALLTLLYLSALRERFKTQRPKYWPIKYLKRLSIHIRVVLGKKNGWKKTANVQKMRPFWKLVKNGHCARALACAKCSHWETNWIGQKSF